MPHALPSTARNQQEIVLKDDPELLRAARGCPERLCDVHRS
jgi:hypothetical protein